jgi:putative colanic acid biosynthesis acetyltransferase WcaF
MERNLADFKSNIDFLEKAKFAFWILFQNIFFVRFYFPGFLKAPLLRFFGAKIGKSVIIRRGVRIHFPWNLSIGDNCWIGEEAWFINHENILIGSNVCISQSVIVCSSGHNVLSPNLDYKHKRIEIKHGAWVCIRATLLPGAIIGINAVVSAGEIFAGTLEDDHLYINQSSRSLIKKMDSSLE